MQPGRSGFYRSARWWLAERVFEVVVVISQPRRCAALGGIGGVRIGGRDLFLFVHRFRDRVLLFQFLQILTHSVMDLRRFRQLLAWNALSLDALASTKLPSTDRCFPCTSPTSTHCRTICSNNSSNSFDY
jgi:hypothetical protein